jgi:hypothetical protein
MELERERSASESEADTADFLVLDMQLISGGLVMQNYHAFKFSSEARRSGAKGMPVVLGPA